MKHVTGILGWLVGEFSAQLVTDSPVIQRGSGLLCFFVGYQVWAFLRYVRSSPQELLAFHGPGSPITRSRSSDEVRAFLSRLHDGGLLRSFEPSNPCVSVDSVQWQAFSDREKVTLAQVVLQACALCQHSVTEVLIVDERKEFLARFSKATGLVNGSKIGVIN